MFEKKKFSGWAWQMLKRKLQCRCIQLELHHVGCFPVRDGLIRSTILFGSFKGSVGSGVFNLSLNFIKAHCDSLSNVTNLQRATNCDYADKYCLNSDVILNFIRGLLEWQKKLNTLG